MAVRMYQFSFLRDKPENILCLGAHCDDIEIGCGGTIFSLLNQLPELRMKWVVFSGNDTRVEETRLAARLFGGERIDVEQLSFKDGYFPYEGASIKDCFEELKGRVAPDIVFTHHIADRHQDHRLVSELTHNTFRSHLILEYEIPKYDGDLGQPTVFMPLSDVVLAKKLTVLDKAFSSQQSRQWFSKSTFSGLARLRGMESNAESGYAEAFYARKIVVTT